MEEIIKFLFKNQDLKYRDFSIKLIPNIDTNSIIGVRVPTLKKYAKEINKDINLRNRFINNLPHKYHEENLIHGYLISLNNNIDNTMNELEMFLPYVNNWAVSDTISPKIFKKNLDYVYPYVQKYLESSLEYNIRFGVVTLLQYYLNDPKYIKKNNKFISKIKLMKQLKYLKIRK